MLSALNIGFFQASLFVAAHRLPGGLAVGAAAIGIAGMAALLLSPNSQWDSIGIAAALAGTACMAAGTFLARRWRPDVPVLAFTAWQLLGLAAVLGSILVVQWATAETRAVNG